MLGDCEAHRERLGRGRTMGAHELWWLTDRTPHESLPLPAGTYRQLRALAQFLCVRLHAFPFLLVSFTPAYSTQLTIFLALHVSTVLVFSTELRYSHRYFRLVTNSVSAWYSRHSTANPLGTQPDCPIVDVDKFEEAQRTLAAEAAEAAVSAPAAAAGSVVRDAQK